MMLTGLDTPPISISGDTHRVVAFRDISLVRKRVMVHYLQQREG